MAVRLSTLGSIASRVRSAYCGHSISFGSENGAADERHTVAQIRKSIPQTSSQSHFATTSLRLAMPSATLSELDGLFHQLQRRMVESGEWDRYGLRTFSDVLLNG